MWKNAYRGMTAGMLNPLEIREKKYPKSRLATPIPVC